MGGDGLHYVRKKIMKIYEQRCFLLIPYVRFSIKLATIKKLLDFYFL